MPTARVWPSGDNQIPVSMTKQASVGNQPSERRKGSDSSFRFAPRSVK